MDIKSKRNLPQIIDVQEASEMALRRATQRALAKPQFQTNLRRMKAKISMGKTIEEALNEIGAKHKQAQMLVYALGTHTIEKKKLYLQHLIRIQTRYGQVEELRRKAKVDNDFKTQSAMILLAAKLDDSLLDLPIRLGLVKDDEQYLPPAEELGLPPEQITVDWLRAEIRRYDEIIAAQEATGTGILPPDALDDGATFEPERRENEVREIPLAGTDNERPKPEGGD